MFICPHCGHRFNIIASPAEHIVCPNCQNGELAVYQPPLVFESAKSLRAFMAKVDLQNRALLNYPEWKGTRFYLPPKSYWVKFVTINDN